MDPFSTLAIAAAVVQFVDFGGKLLWRTWDEYKGRLAQKEDAEITQIVNELSGLAAGVRANSEWLWRDPGHPPSPAESQFLRLCGECDKITLEFHDVLNRIKHRRPGRRRQTRSDALPSGAQGRAELAGMWDSTKIDSMRTRMERLRGEVMTAILFCLWDDSKRTKQWESHFAKQLDSFLEIIKRIEASTRMAAGDAGSASLSRPELDELIDAVNDANRKDAMPTTSTRRAGKPTSRLTEVLLPLADGYRTTSLSKIGDEMIGVLNTGTECTSQIRDELTRLLWTKSWRPDESSVNIPQGAALRHIDPSVISRVIASDLSAGGREESIAQSFKSTYQWIFHRQPKQYKGKDLWQSFPRWLESVSRTPYWITGKPGSGKSTILKFIVHQPSLKSHLARWAGPLPLFITSYYAWNAGLNMQKSWTGLKKHVLFQALNQDPGLIPRLAPRRWALFHVLRDLRADFPTWKSWEIDESFQALLSHCGKSMKLILFVDGLDEFEMPPADVVERIRSLTDVSAAGMKVCVASRPWTEFEDAFNEGPMLQMHRLTHDDLSTFVQGRLQGNRGYNELTTIYPLRAVRLGEDIVTKARGVFLWVSLVVTALLDFLTAGDSIAQLEATLNRLPSDLSSLYDAIWARIPENKLKDASVMIQLVRAAYEPMPWFLMWLADESRDFGVDVGDITRDGKYGALLSLKRRLAARTRGILELTHETNGLVNFSHRTARDWACQPQVWETICSMCNNGFEPYLALVKAEALLMADDSTVHEYSHSTMWQAIMRALWYATRLQGRLDSFHELVETLDNFDKATALAFERAGQVWPSIFRVAPGAHWSSTQDPRPARRGLSNNFVGLAAQFSILPYIAAKAQQDSGLVRQVTSKESIGSLENAVFGYKYYMISSFMPPNGLVEIPETSRFATVQFLLENGAESSKAHSRHGLVSLKNQAREFARDGPVSEQEYFEMILKALEKHPVKGFLGFMMRHLRPSSRDSGRSKIVP